MGKQEEAYEQALAGKKIPILTLDNKWYKLFPNLNDYPKVMKLARSLNDLLKKQGKLNTETKDIRNLKKKLMREIVPMADELEQNPTDKTLEKKLGDNRRFIEECNQKLEGYEDELLELPKRIEQANRELMLATMEYCYDRMQSNTKDIMEIAGWVANIREELKSRLVKKQEMELCNKQMYSYMHDIFGANVIELFDMKYNPLEQAPRKPEENK